MAVSKDPKFPTTICPLGDLPLNYIFIQDGSDYVYSDYNKIFGLEEEYRYRTNNTATFTTYKANAVQTRFHYKNGNADGVCTYYNNSKSYHITYVNGRKHGAYFIFSDGILQFECFYQNDRACFDKRYTEYWVDGDSNRKVRSKCVKEKDQCILTRYRINGRIEMEVPIINNMRNGLQKNYHHNGKVAIETMYVNDVVEGICNTYNEKGVLLYMRHIANSKINGACKAITSDVTVEYNMMDDKAHGPHKKTSKDGKVTIVYYLYGRGIPDSIYIKHMQYIKDAVGMLESRIGRDVLNIVQSYMI
jgi:antitoxin component YwqK of YwqJK toxin-antitoxin module